MTFPYCWIGCQVYGAIIADVISNDAELLEKYNKVEKYFQEGEDNKRNAEESKQGQGLLPSTSTTTSTSTTESTNIKYKYQYFSVRHYDEALYQKQKQNGMKHPNGSQECGMFKKPAFPDDVIEQFERRKQASNN